MFTPHRHMPCIRLMFNFHIYCFFRCHKSVHSNHASAVPVHRGFRQFLGDKSARFFLGPLRGLMLTPVSLRTHRRFRLLLFTPRADSSADDSLWFTFFAVRVISKSEWSPAARQKISNPVRTQTRTAVSNRTQLNTQDFHPFEGALPRMAFPTFMVLNSTTRNVFLPLVPQQAAWSALVAALGTRLGVVADG